jgi:hypothetical protein
VYLKGLFLDDVEERKLRFAAKAEATFRLAGFSNCILNQTVMTAKSWLSVGFHLKPDSKALSVGGLPFFHVSHVTR